MKLIVRLIVISLIAGASAVAVAAAQTRYVSGTVTYRERITLPPTADIEVRLDDVTRPGSTAPPIAVARVPHRGQVPIAFDLAYDAQTINQAGRYAVRATISDRGVLLFASMDTALVLTQGHDARADLVLTRTASPMPPPPPPPSQEPPAPPLPPSPLTGLPATFAGTIPCADCEGIRYQINLFADDSFFARMTYLGRSAAPVDDLGSWALSSDRRVLVLKGQGAQPEMFLFTAPGVLRKLDADGKPIDSKAPYEITRAPAFRPLEVRGALRGMYTYMADAAGFVECSTGQRWPVAAEGANAELERAYSAARPQPGAPVLVELNGLVAGRPAVEGAGTRATLVVEKVGRVLPRDTCAPRFASAPLTGTYWRLTRLGDREVPAAKDQRRQPSLTFDAPIGRDPGRYSGSSGCNRLIGTYVVANATITLTGGGTLIACKDEAAAEAAMLAALKNTRTYRIAGRVLELFDASGTRLARFEK